MSGHVSWAVQVFEVRREGPVASGRVHARNFGEAISRAVEVADLLGGAAVLCLTGTGHGRPLTTIAGTFGRVPDDLAEVLEPA